MQISPDLFKKYLDSWEYTLIDIRTIQEQKIYWIISKKQIHIDISLSDASEKIQKLPKAGKYLIYCWHWVRSAQVVWYMKSLWFEEVCDLEEGINKWYD